MQIINIYFKLCTLMAVLFVTTIGKLPNTMRVSIWLLSVFSLLLSLVLPWLSFWLELLDDNCQLEPENALELPFVFLTNRLESNMFERAPSESSMNMRKRMVKSGIECGCLIELKRQLNSSNDSVRQSSALFLLVKLAAISNEAIGDMVCSSVSVCLYKYICCVCCDLPITKMLKSSSFNLI